MSPDDALMEEGDALAGLAALSQQARLRIYRALIGAGPGGLIPGTLGTALGLPASTLSFHLKELVAAGLVSQERDGRHLIYRPSIARMNALLAYLSAHCCEAVQCDGATNHENRMHPFPDPIPNPIRHVRSTLMNARIYNVLFVCTHNSARSIMAEALLNRIGGGRFRAFSAGSHPALEVHPFALRTLATMQLPVEGYRSKDWNEFAAPDAPKLDFVFTVCDKAAGERCPFWPGQPMTAHWGVSDPAAFEGTDEDKARLFWDTALVLRRRIELMIALPIASLDRLALQRELDHIGQR
ncbi:MAG: hypothetical protein RL322_398 [Pseudomonadota bacterium]|jgi:arsenate reductase